MLELFALSMLASALAASPARTAPDTQASGPHPLLPAAALNLPPCVEDAADACWQDAPALREFRPAAGGVTAPATAMVRLAWDPGGDLLVRVEELPAHALVELTLATNPDDRLDTAAFAQLDAGLHRVELEAQHRLRPGQRRTLRVGLRTAGSRETAVLPWTPGGPVDLVRGFPVVVGTGDGTPPPLRWFRDEAGGWRVEAEPGAAVVVEAWRPEPGRVVRGTPPPFRAEGVGQVHLRSWPETGWLRVTATRSDAAGHPTAVSAGWIAGTIAAPEAGASHDIHPAPRVLEVQPGAAFTLRTGARIVVSEARYRSAADLLARELRRFTGLRLPVEDGGATPGDIVVGADPGSLPPALAAVARQPDGFGLSADARGARVHATTPRSAVYGALALADGIGPDGSLAALQAADAPALEHRVLHHSLRPGAGWRHADYIRFLEQVVARGRYNVLVLGVQAVFPWESHPELRGRATWTPAEVAALRETAEGLGIELVPGILGMVRSPEILARHPRLREDQHAWMLCTRHPDTWPLLRELYDELLGAFEPARFVHIGHDELVWKSGRTEGELRCPRCAGTPRWRLYADSLAWHLDYARSRGLRAIAWSDVLAPGHNGHREGGHRALGLLSDEQRAALVLASWSRLGDQERQFEDSAVPLIRGSTGYLEHKRAGLDEVQEEITGELLALFYPTPWVTFGKHPGEAPLDYQWAAVLAAGATAWRPELAQTELEASLVAWSQLPAYRPGLHTLPARRVQRVGLTGAPWPPGAPTPVWPEALVVGGLSFGAAQPVSVEHGAPLRVELKRPAEGVSLLQAAWVGRSAEHALLALARRTEGDGAPVAELRLTRTDGSVQTEVIFLGTDTGPLGGDRRFGLQWDAAGVLPLTRAEAAPMDPEFGDLRLFRTDVTSSGAPIERVEIVSTHPGATLLVGGMVGIRAARAR